MGGLVLPLTALAWAAVIYVQNIRFDSKHKRYQKLFELMDIVGAQNTSIAGKITAVYELRKYPEYSDVIVRIMADAKVVGDASELLAREMDLTARHFGSSRKPESMPSSSL